MEGETEELNTRGVGGQRTEMEVGGFDTQSGEWKLVYEDRGVKFTINEKKVQQFDSIYVRSLWPFGVMKAEETQTSNHHEDAP